MTPLNPASQRFVESLGPERVWAELLIQKASPGFLLRHVADRALPQTDLRQVNLSDLRKLATFNATGQFRPLRSAPDLPRGWFAQGRTEAELVDAVQLLYPGSIADWFAVQTGTAQPTDYRAYTNRQTGMYRITQFLDNQQAARVIRACCHPRFCLKQRLWTVEGLATDAPDLKSAIPCLEPCAVLLEFARKSVRIEQEESLPAQLKPSDLETLLAAAQSLITCPGDTGRVGDLASPTNPRRLQLVVEKFAATVEDRSQKPEKE